MGEVQREKVAVIIGPTAVGKTKLSIDLAKALNGEIISGDSMQIYRTMDIGTAKVTKAEMDGIPHYMIDIKSGRFIFCRGISRTCSQAYSRNYRTW